MTTTESQQSRTEALWCAVKLSTAACAQLGICVILMCLFLALRGTEGNALTQRSPMNPWLIVVVQAIWAILALALTEVTETILPSKPLRTDQAKDHQQNLRADSAVDIFANALTSDEDATDSLPRLSKFRRMFRTVVILAATLQILTPLIRSYTASVSQDSVLFMASAGLALSVLGHDYRRARHQYSVKRRLRHLAIEIEINPPSPLISSGPSHSCANANGGGDGAGTKVVEAEPMLSSHGTWATNAALFASVTLSSRMPSDLSVQVLLVAAMLLFSWLPNLQDQAVELLAWLFWYRVKDGGVVRRNGIYGSFVATSSNVRFVINAAICLVALAIDGVTFVEYGSSSSSGQGLTEESPIPSPTVLAVAYGLTITLSALSCGLLHPHKRRISGPWDEALPKFD
eukprot:Clim_evm13s211 gene=Clim_evmTU13s211